jgi:hypothetical protein
MKNICFDIRCKGNRELCQVLSLEILHFNEPFLRKYTHWLSGASSETTKVSTERNFRTLLSQVRLSKGLLSFTELEQSKIAR